MNIEKLLKVCDERGIDVEDELAKILKEEIAKEIAERGSCTWDEFCEMKMNDSPDFFPCLHGCDSICPSYPLYRIDRHVAPCPHANKQEGN